MKVHKGEIEMKVHTKDMLIVASLMLLIAPISGTAQNSPDLEVSDPQFTCDVNARFNSRGGSSGMRGIPSTIVTDSPVQQVSARFRNTGTKTIKSIAWEYIAFKDAEMTEALHVYQIHSDTTLLTGESVRLEKSGYHLRHSQYEKARVTRIEYADGTIWQGTKTKR